MANAGIQAQIEVTIKRFGDFELVRWVDGSGSPSTLTIKSQKTDQKYTHYIGYSETASIISEVQSWLNRFVTKRETEFIAFKKAEGIA